MSQLVAAQLISPVAAIGALTTLVSGEQGWGWGAVVSKITTIHQS